jgi:hypothetical protein
LERNFDKIEASTAYRRITMAFAPQAVIAHSALKRARDA